MPTRHVIPSPLRAEGIRAEEENEASYCALDLEWFGDKNGTIPV